VPSKPLPFCEFTQQQVEQEAQQRQRASAVVASFKDIDDGANRKPVGPMRLDPISE